MNGQNRGDIDGAIAASAMTVQTGRSDVAVAAKRDGTALGRIFNQEERRHFAVQQVVEHVAVEILQAQQAMGVIATDALAVGVEFEAQSEQILHEYEDSQLAMAAAPSYMATSRQLLMKGLAEVGQAGFGHISHKIARR